MAGKGNYQQLKKNNIEILKSKIQLENDKVLLLPFENKRNKDLKEIIFEKEIWKFIGIDIKNEKYLTKTIIDKKSDRAVGSTRYSYLNMASQKCEIGWTW